jgi:hypothetical protein
MARVNIPAKALCFGTGNGDACMCHYSLPSWGIAACILLVTSSQVNPSPHGVLGDDGASRHCPLGGVFGELMFYLGASHGCHHRGVKLLRLRLVR